MPVRANITELFENVAKVAENVQRKLSYLLVFGVFATAYLGYELVSASMPLWWNIVKVVLVALPLLIWFFVWMVLGDLVQAPGTIAELASNESDLVPKLKSLNENRPKNLTGMFSAIRTLHDDEDLGVLFSSVASISIIANPLFAILAFIALPILLLVVLVAFIFLIF